MRIEALSRVEATSACGSVNLAQQHTNRGPESIPSIDINLADPKELDGIKLIVTCLSHNLEILA